MIKKLWELYVTFLRVGGLTFGGGMAMLPMLKQEVIEKKGWTTEEELLDIYAIGQCTPGIIAVNTATFIGQKNKGIPGGIIATLGLVFPSLVIISMLAGVITQFSHLAWVNHAFGGVRVCVCILILNAITKLYKKSVIDIPTTLIFFLVFGLSAWLSCSPVWFVLAAAVAGIVLKNVGVKK